MASTSIQTVPSSITSAFSKPQPEYDVFLSFCGEDTRHQFTDHLYHALIDKEIFTFKDDEELKKGESISQELLDAIEKSRMAVVILSENYASSPWCLEELAKIVECRARGILTVLPIFYHVEPTDVRYQKKTFGDAFAQHEIRFKEKPEWVLNWRAALTNVANVIGEPLKDGAHEAKFIRSIVPWIYSKLKDKRPIDIEDDLVGISSRVEDMISYLNMESTDVHFIGICGTSGMGKTTLARAVFNKIFNQFEACSFLENVTEESKAHGIETLQERLLCDIVKGGSRVKDVRKGMPVISNILRNRKVLIVVDDVSEESQLETLVGKRDWFGQGSRIIVTTEDEDLLASYENKKIYKSKELNEDEASKLFSLNAFRKPHCENDFLCKPRCEKDFLEYINNFVKYAYGIPLVLKVLGSHLCTRKKEEWERAQNKLRAIPPEKTTKKLRIAFYGLGADEKKLFLDIACFFKGEEKSRVANILESVYFSDTNLKNLIDKSLITLVGGEKLWMHSLLQQMGREIVIKESKVAGGRSRLWLCEDVLDVLKKNTGTKHIEGMLLRLPPDDEEELNAESFTEMNKLILLKMCKVGLRTCPSYLSNELRLLDWPDYPLESLPNRFRPGELVELIMHRSRIRQLPSEFRRLGKLKLIDLSYSQNLTHTPDFTGFSNIERLNFQGCTRLHELHPSFGRLKQLSLLNLKDCKRLKNLPLELNLESLKILILSGCSRFKKIPEIGRNMTSLLELYLDGTAIEELPPTIRRLTGLTLLNLQDCKNLKSFPSDIHRLASLKILTLSGCRHQPPKAGHLPGFSPIVSSIGATLTFPRLILFLFLSFLSCRYTYLRIPAFALTVLSTYYFHNARHPEPEPINLFLSNSFSKLSALVSLDLSDCNLLALPDDLSCLSSLKCLNLSKNNFASLPDCISQLSKLKILILDHCSRLKSLPYVPLSTQFVSAQGCVSLENYSNQVVVWTSGVSGFTIINGLRLAEDEDGKIAEVSLLDIHPFWQRYVKDQIHQIEGFCHVLPQPEIPEWFNRQRLGSFPPIPLPSNLFSDRNWEGIALCVIFVVTSNSNDVSPGPDTKYFHEFQCRLDIEGDLMVFKVPKETYVGSFGLWLYISHPRFRKHLNERSCITPLIGTNSKDIEIKTCGARILYKRDMGEFLQNLGQNIFGSPNDLCVELKSLLSRLYQVDWARNHLYDYIFPQIACPPRWFAYQNSSSIKMQLPTNLHDDSRWLGFSIYALYTTQMQRNGFNYKQDSTIFLRYHSLSASDEVSFAHYTAFPRSGDVCDDSSLRLVVFYIPRLLFQLNRCSHIEALIESNYPCVQVEKCGIRLVYRRDVAEFVQALVEYMLGSPDTNHHSFSKSLSHQLGMLQDCNHEKDYCCSFLPERRFTPMPKLLLSNETIQGECTSRETIFSNQVIAAGTSKSSSRRSIYLGEISSSLECWPEHGPYLQNRPVTFNQCLPQSEIPGWFKSENIARSSSVTIQLPLDLYENLEWMGFAFCAVFSFQKHPTSVPMKVSEFSFIIVCHLKTDFGCMNPLYSISEEDVIPSLHQRGFLWLSFIPRWFLSREWSGCTSVEFSFVSDSLAVSALKCGVDLVYRQKLKFTLRMIQCITSYDGPFTSYEGFSFYHPDQFSGSDGSRGTSGHYSYDQFYKTAALDRYNNHSIFNQCIPQSEISDWFNHDSLPSDLSPKFDFHPSTSYNFCFPPSKIQDWFSHPNHGHSVTIDLPSNLYHDSNWMGLVLYASFSLHGDPNIIFSNLASGKSHFLYCQCQTSMANVDDQTIAFSTNKEEITWLLNLGGFIWICYVPGEPFKNMLPHCNHIEASFVSDWSGVIVQNCALQLLYQHDQVQFEQVLKHCNNLISENRMLVCKQQDDQKKKKEQCHVDEGLQRKIFSNIDFEVKIFPRLIGQPETDETKIQLGQSDLLGTGNVQAIDVKGAKDTRIYHEEKEACWRPQGLAPLVTLQGWFLSALSWQDFTSSKKLEGLPWNPNAFLKMPNFKFLRIRNISLQLDTLPNSLRYFEYNDYPSKSLPPLPDELVELHLLRSNIELLWGGMKIFENLKFINMDGSSNLIITPNFNGVQNLEEVVLARCSNLRKLHPSFGKLKKLKLLDLKGCQELTSLPDKFEMESLVTLNLTYCLKVKKIPEFVGNMKLLRRLLLEGTAIIELPSSIECLTGLNTLNLQNCKNLVCLPNTICSLTSLDDINLSGCSNFDKLPKDLGNIISLMKLDLSGTAIKELPSSIEFLIGLAKLNLGDCKKFVLLPSTVCSLMSLETMRLSRCPNFVNLPENFGNLKHLYWLSFEGTAIELLPSSVGHLAALECLILKDCKNLVCLPSTICNLKRVRHLDLTGCSKITNLPDNLGNMESLSELLLHGTAIKELPISTIHLKELSRVSFKRCQLSSCSLTSMPRSREIDLSDCNLSAIPSDIVRNLSAIPSGIDCIKEFFVLILRGNDFVSLPESISQFSGLIRLYLDGCKSLRSLPNIPSKVEFICVDNCTSLERVPEPPNDFCGLFDNTFTVQCFNCFKLVHNIQNFSKMFQGQSSQQFEKCYVIPGREIPKWFEKVNICDTSVVPYYPTYKINKKVKIQLPGPESCWDEWRGIVLCVVFLPTERHHRHRDRHGHYIGVDGCQMSYFKSGQYQTWLGFTSEYGKVESHHLWLHSVSKNHLRFSKSKKGLHTFELEIETQGLEVEKFGFRVV